LKHSIVIDASSRSRHIASNFKLNSS